MALRAGRALLSRRTASIFLVALVLRLAVVLWLSDTVPHSDAAYYDMAARRMATSPGALFDRSQVDYYGKLDWWPPGYPAFLAVLYRLAGPNHRVAVFAQVLLGTLVVVLVHRFARRAVGPRIAALAALLVALDPTYVFLTNILASENLYVVWLALGLWWAVGIWPGGEPEPRAASAGRRGGAAGATTVDRRRAVLAGIAFGLGALTRAVGLGVPLVVALAARARTANRRAWLVGSAWLLGATVATIAPWTLRNAVVVGTPALVCFGGGLNFYFGHNEVGIGYRDLAETPMARLATLEGIDREGYRRGFAHLARHPLGFVTRGARKVGALLGSATYAPHASSAILLPDGWQTDPAKRHQAEELRARQRAKNRWLDGLFGPLATLYSWLLVLGAAIACWRWQRLPVGLRLAAWLSVFWIGAHVVFWAQPRFRYPMEMPLALLAAWSLDGLARAARGRRPQAGARRARSAGAPGAAVLSVLFASMLGGAAFLGGCASTPPEVPDIGTWGNPNEPYDDPIEVAAVNALGPRPMEYAFRSEEPIRLGEFLLLDRVWREHRVGLAAALVSEADTWRRVNGVDSLPPYLEALRIDPSSVRAYEHAAGITLQRGQTARAQALALQGVRLESRSGALWGILAETYARAGDDVRARRCLEYALAVGPGEFAGGWQSLAALYLRAGDSARADSLLRQAPDDAVESLRAYVDAVRARERGDLETARSLFAEAARDPRAAIATLIDWGNAEYAAGHLDTAETAYHRALQRSPGEPAALNGLGVVQRARGDAEGAATAFARIVARHPKDAAAQFNLAGASLEAGQRLRRGPRADSLYAVAETAFAACADLGFRTQESRLRHAEVALLRGRALEAYQEARSLLADPSQAGAARMLAARAAVAAERPQDVVTVLAPAYQADSLSADGLDLLGNAYLALEMPQYATPVLGRAHERRPDSWKTAVNYAIALSGTGEVARAEALLRPLLATHPDEPYVLQNLAAVLQRRGRRAEADKLLRRLEQVRAR